MEGAVSEEFRGSIAEMTTCFGKNSGIIGGKGLVEYQAFLAKKAFDIILDSLITEITGEQKKGDNRNGKA